MPLKFIAVEAGRKTVGHGETTAVFRVETVGETVPFTIEVSCYASDEWAKLIAEEVAKVMSAAEYNKVLPK